MTWIQTALPLFSGFILAVFLGSKLIPVLTKLKFGQYIREEGPESHKVKSGTPTMGGIIFLSAILISHMIWMIITKTTPTMEAGLVLGLMVSYAFIGFLDDYRKIKKGRNLGLKAREKLAFEILFAAGFVWFFVDRSSTVFCPFNTRLTSAILPGICHLMIVGMGNAVNFTDGLDGLASGIVAIGLLGYFIISRSCPYLTDAAIPSITLSGAGALIGFLMFNYHPARIFMGDTGALALGGLWAALAVVTKTEILVLFLAVIPVLEIASVVLQVISFQLTGRRIFKMAPLHHHFELLGWKETKVVLVFWIVSLVFTITGLYSMMY